MPRLAFVLLAAVLGSGCDLAFGLERSPEPDGTWAAVSGGAVHTCAIDVDGGLWCWGSNASGQLGVTSAGSTVPVQLAGTWTAVSAGGVHTCAIRDDGSLWCWGDNVYGQLGVGDQMVHMTAVQVPGGPWRAVEAESSQTCAIAADDSLWCWGANYYGQVSDAAEPWVPNPTMIAGAWTQITLGPFTTCALSTDGVLACRGTNSYGQFADPNAPYTRLPMHAAPGRWTSIAVGREALCAVADSGRMRCYGYNTYGELGNGTTTPNGLGVNVGGDIADWTDVAIGTYHVCAHRASGALYCWGDNSRGQIGDPELADVASLPTAIAGGPWIGVGLGGDHTCVIDDHHHLSCTGANAYGQLGIGLGDPLRPQRIEGEWTALGTSGDPGNGEVTCGLDGAGEVSCWGFGAAGYYQLGDAAGRSSQVPSRIAVDGPWDDVVVGRGTACAKRGQSRWCWGANSFGGYGDGSIFSAAIPKQITDGLWSQTMTYHSCTVALGQLWCWGANGAGQAGAPPSQTTIVSAPTQVGTADTWTQVGTGNAFSCGMAAGVVYCWGDDSQGQMGSGAPSTTGTGMMVTVPGISAGATLFVGFASACAVASGAATCWGSNYSGQLSTSGPLTALAPTPLPGRWKQLSIGATHACGVEEDGHIACWGSNLYGQLGDGTLESRFTIARIDDATDWDEVMVGYTHTCARKRDRSAWCWGSNAYGELGVGTAWTRSLARVGAP